MRLPNLRVVLAAVMLCASVALITHGILHLDQPESGAERARGGYRPLEELLAIHKQQGWRVDSGPMGNKRNRVCGAIGDGPLSAGRFFEGAFALSDGRSVAFKIPNVGGMEVDVEGLVPEDGGSLNFVVLKRPYAAVAAQAK